MTEGQPSPKTDAALLLRLRGMGFDPRRYAAAASLDAYAWSLLLGNRQQVAKNPTVEAVAELFADPCTPHGWGTELAIKARNEAQRRGENKPRCSIREIHGREHLVAPDLATLQVDKRSSDLQLKSEFARWLTAEREKEKAAAAACAASRRKSSKSVARTPDWAAEMRRWTQHRVLACIDVDLLAAACGLPQMSHPALARLLFPRRDAGWEYVRNTVRPLTRYLLSEATRSALARSGDL